MRRPLLFAVVGWVSASFGVGCTHVAPYERERLAHPTMQMQEQAGPAEAHVHAVHEGATGGGESGAASGCGCN
jgi:hypothetical protein